MSYTAFKSELIMLNFVVGCGLDVSELKANTFVKPALYRYRFKILLDTWLDYHKIYEFESLSGLCISVRRIFRRKLRQSNKERFRSRIDLRRHLTRSLRHRRFPIQRVHAI